MLLDSISGAAMLGIVPLGSICSGCDFDRLD